MRQLGLILFIFYSTRLFGQELDRVVTTYPKTNDVKEIYDVLKSDKSIKHGEYYSFYKGALTTEKLKTNGLIIDALGFREKGQYKYNLRNGTWTVYREPSSNAKLEEGRYSDDKKIGIWKTLLENGKVIKQFDFDKNVSLATIVNVRWKYPPEATKKGIEGPVKVKVSYKNCEPINFQILEDIGFGCGNAVIQSLKEKRQLEKKYGVTGTCDKDEEIIDVKFKIEQ